MIRPYGNGLEGVMTYEADADRARRSFDAARDTAIAEVAADIRVETDCTKDHARFLAEARVDMVISALRAQRLLDAPP
jgi:hypothetical protein